MAKFESQALKAIKSQLHKAKEKILVTIGEEGVKILKESIDYEKYASERLIDSFSYATKQKKAQVGPNAEESDGAPQPTANDTVIIGTKVPYAVSVDKGTVNNFQYGKNGAPANFQELVKALEVWILDKIQHGTFRGDVSSSQDIYDFAYRIAKHIEEYGTDEYPFWDDSVVAIKELARELFNTAIEDIIKNQTGYVTKVEITL